MAWLKGVRTDGYIRIDENVNFRGTVVGGIGAQRPYGSLDYFVDGTDGVDSNSGKTWEGAFKTIDRALTVQTADTNAKGDYIWIAPGTYAETVSGDMTSVSIIGVDVSGIPGAVNIAPTDGNAFVGDMTNSAWRNVCFKQATSTNTAYAYVAVPTMEYSVIDNCLFLGTTNVLNSTGFRIGAETPGAWEHMVQSAFTNNTMTTDGVRNHQADIGIMFGPYDSNTHADTRQFMGSQISNNLILAESWGIWLETAITGCGGGVISHNTISSNEGFCAYTSITHTPGTDVLCIIARNSMISAEGIIGFTDGNTLWNVHAISGVPVMDLPLSA